jgi:hypothetical protein
MEEHRRAAQGLGSRGRQLIRSLLSPNGVRQSPRPRVEPGIEDIFRVVSRRVETRGSLPAASRGRLTEAGLWRSRSGCALSAWDRPCQAGRDTSKRVQGQRRDAMGRGAVRTLSRTGARCGPAGGGGAPHLRKPPFGFSAIRRTFPLGRSGRAPNVHALTHRGKRSCALIGPSRENEKLILAEWRFYG